MHEMSVATALYRACRVEMRRRGGGQLVEVTVAIGELSGVEPDLLRFAWDAIVADGPDAGAALEIQWCPARQKCPNCGPVEDRQPGSWLRLCPDCQVPLVIAGGDELEIRQFGYDGVVEFDPEPQENLA